MEIKVVYVPRKYKVTEFWFKADRPGVYGIATWEKIRVQKKSGLRYDPTYRTWTNMKTRCTNPKTHNFDQYGGRGVRVCDRWKSYKNFLDDMGVKPKGKWLDRIDTNGDYEPYNCKWSTPVEQQNNRRNNNLINHKGETKTLNQWAASLGIKPSTLRQRHYVYKWDINRCLTTPTGKRG